MRELSKQEVKGVNGAWMPLVIAAVRLGWALYRHHKLANAATWAARGAGIIGGTYHLCGQLDPNR